MKKLIRIIVSPVVLLTGILSYVFLLPMASVTIVMGIGEWLTRDDSDGVTLGLHLLILPFIEVYNWIQHPERMLK